MTSNEITLPGRPPVATASRVGQATSIEQSRAVAEVYAAVMIAQQNPRNVQAAIRAMEQACRTPELANVAFYSVPRGGKTATDVSIHLARELTNTWGNIHSGVTELSLDEQYGQSEMQAVAWDLEINNRVALTFIQPHKRAGKGAARLDDVQAIYETNANAGARRLRQCILSVLPKWYVERAKALCQKTLNDGGGKPLPERVADALKMFEEFNVAETDIVRAFGKTSDRWTPVDLGKLRITYESLKQGTIQPDEAFPPQQVTRADVAAARPAVAEPAPPAPSTADPDTELVGAILDATAAVGKAVLGDDYPATPADGNDPPQAADRPDVSAAPPALVSKVKDQLFRIGVNKPRDQLDVISRITGEKFTRWGDLTTGACTKTAEMLVRVGHADEPLNALDQVLAELTEPDGSE